MCVRKNPHVNVPIAHCYVFFTMDTPEPPRRRGRPPKPRPEKPDQASPSTEEPSGAIWALIQDYDPKDLVAYRTRNYRAVIDERFSRFKSPREVYDHIQREIAEGHTGFLSHRGNSLVTW